MWLSNYIFSNVFVAMQHPWNGPFLGSFWALPSPNMNRVCWNFDHRYVFHKKNTVSEQSFKITCLSGNGTYPKLIVLVHFWAQFTPKIPKCWQNSKLFFRNYVLWLSNNTSPRSQINHRIYIKLIKKKTFLWPKMDFLK